jgi:hypothetical protein
LLNIFLRFQKVCWSCHHAFQIRDSLLSSIAGQWFHICKAMMDHEKKTECHFCHT